MKNKTIVLIAGMLAILIPAVALAAPDGVPHGRWWRSPEMSASLNLSQTETDALDTLYVQNRRALIELKNDLEREHFELENILEQRSLDEQAALEQFAKIELIREKLARERFRYLLDVRKIIGYERYARLMAMARDFRDRSPDGPREPLR